MPGFPLGPADAPIFVAAAPSGAFKMTTMKVLFYLGWVLLALAFTAGAAQVVPRALPGGTSGGVVSAYELWYAAWPGTLITTQIKIERLLHPWLWDPALVTLLKLPAWLLLGLPGAMLTWFLRPQRGLSEAEREDLRKQEESLLLYDRLAREAREAGFGDHEDDQLPDHASHDVIDGRGVTTLEADYDMKIDLAGDEEAVYAEGLAEGKDTGDTGGGKH